MTIVPSLYPRPGQKLLIWVRCRKERLQRSEGCTGSEIVFWDLWLPSGSARPQPDAARSVGGYWCLGCIVHWWDHHHKKANRMPLRLGGRGSGLPTKPSVPGGCPCASWTWSAAGQSSVTLRLLELAACNPA